jgi:hypothetical protein
MPTPRRAMSWGSAPVTSSPQHGSGRRFELTSQHLEESALAGAVRTDQTAQLPLTEAKVDVPNREDAAEAHI